MKLDQSVKTIALEEPPTLEFPQYKHLFDCYIQILTDVLFYQEEIQREKLERAMRSKEIMEEWNLSMDDTDLDKSFEACLEDLTNLKLL